MQQELENNFFHNQPDHLKQIVDFISERISNSFVRILKEDLIQSGLKTVIDVIATNLKVYEGKYEYFLIWANRRFAGFSYLSN